MSASFYQLNHGWNAEPNAPEPSVSWDGDNLVLRFLMNPFQFPGYDEDDVGRITFFDCARYRLGSLDDHGWYLGQGRFTGIDHRWGEFYEVTGDLRLEQAPDDWEQRIDDTAERRHFLFYFRDRDFECDARDWSLEVARSAAT